MIVKSEIKNHPIKLEMIDALLMSRFQNFVAGAAKKNTESNTSGSRVLNLGCAMKVTWCDSYDAPSTNQDLL